MSGSAGDSARTRIMAARIIAAQRWPYTATLLFGLKLVETPCAELDTVAVDRHWRLYYCPDFIESCTPETLATVLLHEAQHLMLNHSERFDSMRQAPELHPQWNAAGDAVINDVLDEAGMPWPDVEPVRYATLAKFGVTEGMTTEAAYFVLIDQPESTEPVSGGMRAPEGGGGDAASDGGEDAEGGEGDGADGRGGDTASDVSEDSANGGGESSGGSEGGDGQATGRSGGQGSTGEPSESDSQEGERGGCGSGAGGPPRSYELARDDAESPGLGQAQQDLIRDRVAQAVLQHAEGQGSVPRGILRWAEEALHPKVDWRRVLAGFIRKGLASAAGRRDYTYQFPSRRADALREPLAGAVLPAMRQPPPPRVAVVLDTSGSIGPDELTLFAGEVHGIVRSVGFSSGFTVIPCDARAYAPIRIRRAADIESMDLPGGGGTDMGAGLEAAVALRPRPDVIVVLTDGWTPWPAEQPGAGVAVVVALTSEATAGRVPGWAKWVVIELGDDSRV